MNNENTLIIDENKTEKVTFIIDCNEEILKDDFIGYNNEKLFRYNVIFEEINNFCKLKDYFSSKSNTFALIIYTNKLIKIIDDYPLKDFLPLLNEHKKIFKDMKFSKGDYLDLSEIFNEGLSSLSKVNNETIIRYILFYNRSDVPVKISNTKEHNITLFVKLTNFYFDVVFLRKKINSEEDKKMLLQVFNSLTGVKTKLWYAFESSGILNKFKYYMNLLMANANQRIKFSDVDKFQKNSEDIIKNLIEN